MATSRQVIECSMDNLCVRRRLQNGNKSINKSIWIRSSIQRQLKTSLLNAVMDEHLEKDCKNELRQCKFAEYNCTFKGVKCDLEKHIQDSMSKHLDMVMFETVRLRLKDAQSQRQIADLENRNSILKEKQKVQAKELQELREKCDGNTTTLQTFQVGFNLREIIIEKYGFLTTH
ncbi:uncharacterized protein LOC117122177 [Anneissia japonica]|uniref:uncharacterized protein LOC117122177 n=1 Tax=Anneissia japonica TaxID=1529436 RepID=UPI0014254EF1|nr:uncharacterized protein LOC117122177 [Anneissia japonica]